MPDTFYTIWALLLPSQRKLPFNYLFLPWQAIKPQVVTTSPYISITNKQNHTYSNIHTNLEVCIQCCKSIKRSTFFPQKLWRNSRKYKKPNSIITTANIYYTISYSQGYSTMTSSCKYGTDQFFPLPILIFWSISDDIACTNICV